MDERNNLPKGWVRTTLGEIQKDGSRSVLPSNTPDKMFELYSVTHFNKGRPEIISGKEIGSGKRTVEEGTVLLCGINPRINRVWVVGNHSPYLKIASTEWRSFSKQEEIEPKYLAYFMQQNPFRDFLAANASGVGGSLMRVHSSVFAEYLFPLAPLPEQHRIVTKIEELFSDLDAGVAALKKTQAQLKRYRQAVLKAAVEGKLTAEWRAAHRGEIEPASALLERIRAERATVGAVPRARPARGVNGGMVGGDHKGSPLRASDAAELGALPEGWEWGYLNNLAADEPHSITDGPFGSNLKTEHYTESGPRVIRLQNIGGGVFVDARAHISQGHFERLRKHEIFAGDVVIAGLGETLPRACIIPESVGFAIVKADCIRFKPKDGVISARFLNIILNSDPLKKIANDIVHGVGRPRLNQQQIKSLPIPVAPFAEQQQIVAEVERRLSVADETEKIMDASLKQAERLRQSILKRAFAGKLVPQDPSDEPAERLLERIKQIRIKETHNVVSSKRRSQK